MWIVIALLVIVVFIAIAIYALTESLSHREDDYDETFYSDQDKNQKDNERI